METPNVGTVPADGAGGTPTPPVSQKGTPPIEGADQLLSALRGEFKAQFDGVLKEVRGLQSRQDKAENSFTEQLARLEHLTGQGLTKEQALARMNAEDADVNWRKNLETKIDSLAAQLGSAGTQSNSQQVVSQVFSKVGLDPQDPRVAQHLVREYKSQDEMELAAYRLQRELALSPNPTTAQSASVTGKLVANEEAQLIAALQELQKSPVKNSKEIAEIEVKLGWR